MGRQGAAAVVPARGAVVVLCPVVAAPEPDPEPAAGVLASRTVVGPSSPRSTHPPTNPMMRQATTSAAGRAHARPPGGRCSGAVLGSVAIR